MQWTDRAKEYLRNREYRYLSPVVLVRKNDGRAVQLLGAALTNLPAIDGMAPVVNSMQRDFKSLYMEVLKFLDLPEDAEADAVKEKARVAQQAVRFRAGDGAPGAEGNPQEV